MTEEKNKRKDENNQSENRFSKAQPLRHPMAVVAQENDKLKIKTQQFGKTKDGTLYLIDPGCVMAPVEKFSISKFLSKLFSKIKK